jgi:sulfur-carrier protein adenylyltransferase/sulfurtransferase
MATPRELLAEARAKVREVTPEQAAELVASGARLLDVREGEEVAQGAIAGSVHVPRGHLEFQVEGRIPVKDEPLVVYCAGGVRSAFAAATLEAIGYSDVVSMEGGFGRWKDEGRPWAAPKRLSQEQMERYHRHLLLPEVGQEGQAKLLDSRVLLLGAGGLGSPAALYLAAAGVGTIGIIDMDVVDRSNLQRQILHTDERVGERKVDSAKKALTALNPDVDVVAYDLRLGADNVMAILEEGNWQVIVDGTDNFNTRFLLNDASLLAGVPVVHGSIFRFEGQVTTFVPGQGPCYRCLVPEAPPAEFAPNCAEAGVLGVLPGIVGSLQAMEAIKLLLGVGDPLVGRLIAYDALEQSFRELRVPQDPNCPTCSPDAPPIQLRDEDFACD